MILREDFRVVKVDKELLEYTTKLTDFIFAVNKIGVLYNQAAVSYTHLDVYKRQR